MENQHLILIGCRNIQKKDQAIVEYLGQSKAVLESGDFTPANMAILLCAQNPKKEVRIKK